jgi:hypothetical protein
MDSDLRPLTAFGSVYHLLDTWPIRDMVRPADDGRATESVLPSHHARGKLVLKSRRNLLTHE